MIRASAGHVSIVAMVFLMTLAVFTGGSEGQQEGEKIERGRYFLRRAPSPEYSVARVDLHVMSEARFPEMRRVTEGPAGKFGRVQTLFDKKSRKQIEITGAVYESVSMAEDAALELLNSVSAVLAPGSASAGVIGTHSWYMKSPDGSGVVIFVYNNSLFQLFSSDYNYAENSARSIIADLKEGRNGVTLGGRSQIR